MIVKEILTALGMIFGMIIPGIIFRKRNLLSKEQEAGINFLIVNLTWPCLVIDAMQLEYSPGILNDTVYLTIVCLIVFALGTAFALPLSKLLHFKKSEQCLMAFAVIFANTGFIGIPVIKALYDGNALFYAAILEVINDILLFTIGIILIQMSAGSKIKLSFKGFISPGLIGVFIGLMLFFAQIELPQVLAGSLARIGDATTPLTMISIGMQLGGLTLKELLGNVKVYVICIIRLIIVPAIALIFILLTGGQLGVLQKVLILMCAMPAASITAIFSRQYKGEAKMASSIVLLSTVMSLVTIPVLAIIMEII